MIDLCIHSWFVSHSSSICQCKEMQNKVQHPKSIVILMGSEFSMEKDKQEKIKGLPQNPQQNNQINGQLLLRKKQSPVWNPYRNNQKLPIYWFRFINLWSSYNRKPVKAMEKLQGGEASIKLLSRQLLRCGLPAPFQVTQGRFGALWLHPPNTDDVQVSTSLCCHPGLFFS